MASTFAKNSSMSRERPPLPEPATRTSNRQRSSDTRSCTSREPWRYGTPSPSTAPSPSGTKGTRGGLRVASCRSRAATCSGSGREPSAGGPRSDPLPDGEERRAPPPPPSSSNSLETRAPNECRLNSPSDDIELRCSRPPTLPPPRPLAATEAAATECAESVEPALPGRLPLMPNRASAAESAARYPLPDSSCRDSSGDSAGNMLLVLDMDDPVGLPRPAFKLCVLEETATRSSACRRSKMLSCSWWIWICFRCTSICLTVHSSSPSIGPKGGPAWWAPSW
mmetsp:Transcript_143817/g.459542  ORF Transcript_143817/g.459542 Transcript_143817/m.459542 type:complete len:281 (+) Transcript_143817:325-1167(+)